MTTYKYTALTKDGARVNGVIEAYSEFEAVDDIRRDFAVVEKITEVKSAKREHIDLNEPLWVSDKTLMLTSSQFAIMLRSGLSMSRIVSLIAQQSSDRLMKRILTAVAGDVSAGYSLAASMERNGKKLPATFIETVRSGEASGTLETAFERLKVYYDKSSKVKQKVRGAMIYPIVLLVLAVVVVGIVMTTLVPTMIASFEQSGADLPGITRALIAVSHFFQKGWAWLLSGFALLAIGLFLYSRTEDGRVAMAKLSLRLPVLGRIGRMKAASQFANTMSTLLSAGLPVTQAMTTTGRVVDNYAVGLSLGKTVVGLETGHSLREVLSDNPYLPEMLVEMTAVGEESGALEETLSVIGTYYDDESQNASTKALSMLEPAITLILGGLVGFIVLAIYIGQFAMYGGMI